MSCILSFLALCCLASALADLDYAVRGGANVDAGTELTLMVAGAERAGR